MRTRASGSRTGVARLRAGAAGVAVLALALGGCGLKSGSVMVDDVSPGSVGAA